MQQSCFQRNFCVKICLGGYKTQEMCDKAVDSYYQHHSDHSVFSNDDVVFDDIDSDIVIF